ncbi:multidrug effflux MFS transporter [Legionella spiritensis]|uniref:multidrug effflux MFS transporter n=1 Tax=Legionella spiritensis TaxID=452 RepID=UPI000F6EC8FB|nr:multidrug effflux MFS transporter [Legionella spiritensis]VEG90065.1 multidrug resistance protein D [Legionella spiritensis]
MQRKKTPFLYLGALAAFSLLVFDLYQPALPAITRYFNTSHALGQLTLSLFFFIFGISQLVWGPFIDHYGRNKILRYSLYLFLLATIICMLAPNIETLIAGRALQGFAVCCSNVVAFSCSRDEEDSTDRARLLSHIAMIVSVSPIFAPLIGSVIFVYLGWRTTFLFMALGGGVLLLFSRYCLCESPFWRDSRDRLTFKKLLWAYKELLTHKRLWITIAIITASYSCVMIVVVNIAYLMIDNLGISPTLFSIFFASNGLIMILGNWIGIKIRKHRNLPWNIRFGSRVMVSGSLLTVVLFYLNGLSLVSLAPLLLINLGVTLTNPPTLSLALSDYQHQASTAIALFNTVRMSLSAIIAGIVGSLVVFDEKLFAFSLLFCSIVCMLFSLVCKE